MSKKLSITAIIISVSVAVIIYMVFKLRGGEIHEPVKAIPSDAVAILQINKPESLLQAFINHNDNWQALTEFKRIGEIHSHLLLIDSLINHHPDIGKSLLKDPVMVSLHETGKARFDLLTSVYLSGNIGGKRVIQSIKGLFDENTTFRERKYENTIIHDWQSEDSKYRLSFATKQGLLLLSTSPVLLEDAIRQTNVDSNLLDEPSFQQVASTANKNAEATLFVNFRNLPKIFQPLLVSSEREQINRLKSMTHWMALDLKVQNAYLLLNGYTRSSDSLHHFLQYFSQQPPEKNTVIPLLPSNTIFYCHLNFNDFSNYLVHLQKYQQEHGSYYETNQSIEPLNRNYNIDVLAFMKANFDREGALAFIKDDASSRENQYLMIYKNKGHSQASKAIAELIRSIAASQNKSPDQLMQTIEVDASTQYTIYKLPFNTLSHYPLQPLFHKSNARYLVVYDNYFVFGNSKSTLEHFLTSNIRRNHIYAKADYAKVTDFFPSKTNASFYAEFPQVIYLLQNQLEKKVFDSLSNHMVALSNFGSVGTSLYATNNMLNTNLFVTQVPEVEKSSTTLWETMLDTVSTFKPTFVKNHNTNENEIFLQDENNTIYLINKTGRILWKLPLTEKITSEVSQIDFYNNGKLQLLFSTNNYLHLFDRLGNYVDRYPIRLRASSDLGMSLFDYAGNKQYRICVPGNDRRVYMYNKEGQLLKGWAFEGADHRIITPVQHVRVKTNDYIVLADERRAYILNRRGTNRVEPDKQYALAGSPFYLAEASTINDSYLITSDTSGAVIKFYLSGKTDRHAFFSATDNHHYVYHDLDGNGTPEHIYLTSDALTSFKRDGKQLFEYKLPGPSQYAPVIFDFGTRNQKTGITLREQNKLFLINNDGTLYKGFPLDGCAPFSIGYLNNNREVFNLVVPNENNFLYNYAVH